MMDTRFPLACVLVALVTGAAPDAAVTNRTLTEHYSPRAAWRDRYGEARQGQEQTEHLSKSFKVGADGALDLSNVSGDVQVTGGSGSEIRVEATKRVRHRDADEARRMMEQLRVEITHVGNRVEVRTMFPRRGGRSGERGLSASVDFVVTVPSGAAVAVKTISGDVTVGEVNGEVRAETVSGDVNVTATPNLTTARTVSGDVTARDIGGTSTLSLGTVSGTVIAAGLKARTLECGTVSGDLQLSALDVERLLAKSVSGNIEFSATLAKGGRYEFNSHSGDVRIQLAGAPGFELNASTFSGSVRSDFPITLRADSTPAGRNRQSGASTRAIRGAFGDASAVLSVQSFSGSVVITRK